MGAQRQVIRRVLSIPVFDSTRQYRLIKKEIQKSINDVLDSGCYIGGKVTEAFEQRLAHYCGTKYAIAVANGTAALYLSLLDAGVEAGDTVLVPSHTFIATIEAIKLTGAEPIYCDVSPFTYNIRLDEIETKRNKTTKAIIPVHMYGNMCAMRDIVAYAKKNSLSVIEDACQAIGSEQNGRKAGSFGDYGCFSFYPTKNLGAYGEGGAIVTDKKSAYINLKQLRNHNALDKFQHDQGGFNFRISEIQSGILLTKMNHLDDWIQRRRDIASIYNRGLLHVTKPEESKNNKHSYHLYVVRSEKRKHLCNHLEKRGIGYGLHYPIPCHTQYGNNTNLPYTGLVSGQVVSLPMFPELTDNEAFKVCQSVNEA